jgi:phosphoribosylglycinamide formyltransferase-1
MKLSVAILISGSGSNMVQLIKSMDDNHPAFPSIVISNKPNAAGIKKARDLGIPTQIINENFEQSNGIDFEAELTEILNRYEVKIICLAGFMRILSKDFIDVFKGRILNIHPSLLPKYKGLNTHARAIAAKDKFSGCSVHLVTAELDGGPILAQRKVFIDKTDTAETLSSKVLEEEHLLYPEVLLNFTHQIKGTLNF